MSLEQRLKDRGRDEGITAAGENDPVLPGELSIRQLLPEGTQSLGERVPLRSDVAEHEFVDHKRSHHA